MSQSKPQSTSSRTARKPAKPGKRAASATASKPAQPHQAKPHQAKPHQAKPHQTQPQRFDVIIVGGGPVGLSMALALLRFVKGLRVAICDMRPVSVPDDARAFALAAAVRRVYEGLGVWPDMASAANPIRRMRITDSGQGDISRPVFLSFAGDVAPAEPYAHMVPHRTAMQALIEGLGKEAQILAPVRVAKYRADNESAQIELEDGRILSAPLIIAADGVRSQLRAAAGIDTIGHDYAQMGVVTTIAHEFDHEGTAYEHFRPAGPFASLPLPGKRSSLVWTERTAEAQRLRELPADRLAERIEGAMGSVLGKVEVVDAVQAFPLRLQIAKSFHGQRLALIGDAAHVVHPIAGQGLNLGIGDVAALSEILVDALRLGQDIGAEDILQKYTAWRRFDTGLMAAATDGLNHLFSNDIAPVRALRDLGLGVVDRLPPLKNGLIRHAAGLGRHTPKLMLGSPL